MIASVVYADKKLFFFYFFGSRPLGPSRKLLIRERSQDA